MQQISQFLAQTANDARLGLVNCVGSQAQICGDVCGSIAIHRDAPERLPSAIFERQPDQLGHLMSHQTGIVLFGILEVGRVSGTCTNW